ncbi:radical SAM/SPASM domain-containing protein [Peptoniphilus sp.]|uniref:radical SAM protein n=1 Tax=Peptoniphilus sp. TaxID=1971214 RepID=UPI003992E86B
MDDKIRLDDVAFSDYTRIIIKNDYIVIGDILRSGLWIKIPVEDYYYIKPYIGIVDGYKKLMNSLESVEYKVYYTKLLRVLAKIKVLVNKEFKKREVFIKDLSLELTTACNLRCRHCSGMYGSKENEFLSNSHLKSIINWANTKQINSLTLTGGEIFCIEDIYEKLKYIRNNFNGNISIITNATLFSEEKVSVLTECVDEINISLDGYDKQSVDFIRGKGTFTKVMGSIKQLQLNGFYNITLSMILTSDNSIHIDKFKKLCKKMNVRPITRILAIKGRAIENYDFLISESNKGAEDNILKHINMLSMCNAGFSMISITASGAVTLCASTEDSNIVLGNYNDLDMISKNISHIQQTCIVDKISPCKFCDVRYFCSSKCYSTNINIFTNPYLRKQRCIKYREKLQKYVWG